MEAGATKLLYLTVPRTTSLLDSGNPGFAMCGLVAMADLKQPNMQYSIQKTCPLG